MLGSDLHLKQQATSRRNKNARGDDSDDGAGFHFIAYMPIAGDVWKLDGLERQPHRIGLSNSTSYPARPR